MPEGPRGSARGPGSAGAAAPSGPRSDSQLRLLAESLPHIVWMARPDGFVDYFNRHGAEFVGGPPEVAHGSSWTLLIHPDDRERVCRAWAQSMASGDAYDVEYRLRAANGSYRMHWCRASPIRGARGEIVKWVGTATDIEDRPRRDEPGSAPAEGVLRFGDLAIDLSSREVWLHQCPVELTRREFDLLSHLVLERGRTVTREHLLEVAWSSSARWQTAATITEHVRRLRLKLEDDPTKPRMIVTVRGTGYRFDSPDEPHRVTLPAGNLDSSKEAMVLLRGADIVSANPAMLDVLDVHRMDEIIGRPIYEFVAPGSQRSAQARQARIREGSWPRPEVLTMASAVGTLRAVEIASTPVTWEGETVSQVTLWPVEATVPGDDDDEPAIIVTDADFAIQSFNPSAELLYGWREDEVVGRSVLDVIPWAGDPDGAAAAADHLRRDGRWHGHAPQVCRDGTTVLVQASVTMLHGHDGQPVGVIAINHGVLAQRPVASATAGEPTGG